jgi:opacity protein-like surface antigen
VRKVCLGKILIFLTVSIGTLSAGDIYQKAESPVAAIRSEGLYIGLGSGWMRLKDHYTQEYFQTVPVALILGYRWNDYLGIEARYYRDSGRVRYDGGNTAAPDDSDFPTTFQAYGVYLKPSVPFEDLTLYGLLGYGYVSLSDIMGADREEHAWQYGGGVSWSFRPSWRLFIDYLHLYGDKGFDGRAKLRRVTSQVMTVGVTYAF